MMDFDPRKNALERRAAARIQAAHMTEERRRELLAKDRRPIPSDGMLDAVSVPIEAEFGAAPFMTGKSSDWLYAVGSGKNRDGRDGAVPRHPARADGSIYVPTSVSSHEFDS